MNRFDVIRVRDSIYAGLLVRQGQTLTDDLAKERANNITSGLEADIDDMIAAAVREAIDGPREGEATPTGYDVHETMEEHAGRVIK